MLAIGDTVRVRPEISALSPGGRTYTYPGHLVLEGGEIGVIQKPYGRTEMENATHANVLFPERPASCTIAVQYLEKIIPVMCVECESHPVMINDYLCEECRHAT